jgi:hypothetical protein
LRDFPAFVKRLFEFSGDGFFQHFFKGLKLARKGLGWRRFWEPEINRELL